MITLEEEIRSVRALRRDYEEKRTAADEAEAAWKKARLALWERMDATGVKSINIDSRTASAKSTIYGTISDKAKFIEWAEENAPELVAPAPRKGLVNELVRQRLDNNEELPPGVNWYVDKYVSDTGD
jgi:hypothetical protein